MEQVHAFANTFFSAFRHIGMRVVFILYSDVVIHVLPFLVHAAHAVLQDDGQLVGKSRVIGNTIGHHRRHDVTVAILMLQAFPVQCRSTGRSSNKESPRPHVAGCPGQVAHPLEAEHGIKNKERNHRHAGSGIARGCGNPGGHCTCLGNALLQNLTLLIFLVEHQLVGIDRGVKLPD